MKKLITLLAACFALAGYSQITNSSPVSPSFSQGAQIMLDSVLHATNWTVVGGYGRSLESSTKLGNKNVAFAAVAYNFTENVGLIAGYDTLWSGSGATKSSTFNALKGGLSLQLPTHPFAFVGSTFLTNVVATPFVADLLATPKSGDAIGNIVTAGINFDLWAVKNFEIVGGVQIEKRTGQGDWDGKYALFHLGVSRRF